MQSKMRIYGIIVTLIIFTSFLTNMFNLKVRADADDSLANRSVENLKSVNYADLLGLSEKYFHTEAEYDLVDPEYELKELVLNQNSLSFQANGYVEYVDAIGTLEDGTYVNVSEFASWTTSDMNIATVHAGRINATGKGEAEITVKYGNHSCELSVVVAEGIDWLAEITEQVSMQRAESPEYIRTLAIANQTWSPNSNIYQWKETKYDPVYFYAGTTYKGYPYTQYGDCYPVSYLSGNIFTDVLNNTNFLKLTTRTSAKGNSVYCPYYGLDCSGFVCYALQTPKKYTTQDMIANISSGVFTKVGSYSVTSPTESELMLAYEELAIGDVLVKNGHCLLVVSNVPSQQKIMVTEQTPPITATNTYTYYDLAKSGQRYLPCSYN